jgi:hypothetical protein
LLVAGQASPAEPAALDAAFDLVKTAVVDGEIPGAIALVSKDDKVVREEAYLMRSATRDKPAPQAVRFHS